MRAAYSPWLTPRTYKDSGLKERNKLRNSQVTKMGRNSLTEKSHSSIFDGANQSTKLPKKWFDFIVISQYFLTTSREKNPSDLQGYIYKQPE